MVRLSRSGLAAAFLLLTASAGSAMAEPIYTVQNFTVAGSPIVYFNGLNDNGQVVGSAAASRNAYSHAIIDTVATGAITMFDVPDATLGSTAVGINDSGQVAAFDSASFASYVRNPDTGAFTPVVSSCCTIPHAVGLDNAGQVLAVYNSGQTPFTERGAVIDPVSGDATILSASPEPNATFPSGINDLGQVVGSVVGTGSASFVQQGFVYDLGTGVATLVNDPAGVNGTALLGINDVGQAIGQYLDARSTPHGFLLDLTTGTYSDLPFVGSGINDAGQIVGTIFDEDHDGIGGFIATPQATTAVPEPASLVLLGTGLLGWSVSRRRRDGARRGGEQIAS